MVIKRKRSVVMFWFNDQKALDNVPHEWILIALKLAKVLRLVMSAIETLMQKLLANLCLTVIQSNHIQSTNSEVFSKMIVIQHCYFFFL